MTYAVQVTGHHARSKFKDTLIAAVLMTLEHSHAAPGDVGLALVDAETMQALNRQFADHDFPTDVLSFPDGMRDPETQRLYHGDVIIALPVAERQAQQGGHSVAAELTLLAVHGTLHLLGHDHATQKEKDSMWQQQSQILERLGCEIRAPREPQ